jgi:inner membrane protein
MLIAHLPAGYILGRSLKVQKGTVMWAALIGSVFPDLDMFWFHLVDHRAFHHHRYWVHAPGFWLAVAAVLYPLAMWKAPKWKIPLLVFLAAVLIHLCLDTIGGGIMWLWPFADHLYAFVEVPATQSHWVLSFIVHWTFWAEVAIVAFAAVLWLRRAKG